MQIIEGKDLDKSQTLQQLIESIVEKTNWDIHEESMIEIDEGAFSIQIKVVIR